MGGKERHAAEPFQLSMKERAQEQYQGWDHGDRGLWFRGKLAFMIFLQCADVLLNSSVEYDENSLSSLEDDMETIRVIVLVLQLLVQICISLTLFVIMFDTYPFRVGLMGLLMNKFKSVFAVNLVYFIMTAGVYSYRLQVVGGWGANEDPWVLWAMPIYWAASILQKLMACIFYVGNTYAAFKLGDPIFYGKKAWIDQFYMNTAGRSAAPLL